MSDEERWIDLLVACDEAVAAGDTPTVPLEESLSTAQQAALERSVRCMQLLSGTLADELATVPRPPESSAAPGENASDIPFTRLGRFLICCELSRDAHGTTFLAYDPQAEREATVQVLRPEALSGTGQRERFLRAARAAVDLEHDNVVAIHEVGEARGVSYVASASCRGLTVAAWLAEREEPVPPRVAAEIVAALASALHHAHGRGVFHGAIDPGDILLEMSEAGTAGGREAADRPRYTPRLKDFGLARILAGETPEETRGGTVPSDLRSLGVLLHEILTRQPPRGEDAIPAELRAICLRCSQHDPGQQFGSARELADELRRFLTLSP